jgi:hypothetical protein
VVVFWLREGDRDGGAEEFEGAALRGGGFGELIEFGAGVNPPEAWRAPLYGFGSSRLGHVSLVVDG